MRTVVAVLRGGPSLEYEHSLKSGAEVLAALNQEKYEPRDIFISRGGEWHMHGVPVAPERALFGTDVAFNALHGQFGEDGGVQRLMQQLGVPYTGSDALASAIAFNKQHTRDEIAKLGLKVAHGVVVEHTGDIEALAHELFRTMPNPAIVKPVVGGSSIGVGVADNFNALQTALEQAFGLSPQVLVEEYIKGKDATVGVIDNFRNEATYALIPSPHDLLSQKEKNELTALAKKIHQGLGLSHYSASDFVVSKRGIYFLEVNSLPKLGAKSHWQEALGAVGAKLSDFVEHVLHLARK